MRLDVFQRVLILAAVALVAGIGALALAGGMRDDDGASGRAAVGPCRRRWLVHRARRLARRPGRRGTDDVPAAS